MTLFESNSQYREKTAIWHVLSNLPLHSSLSKGHVWRWWAANIPMDLGTGGEFTSDMDLVGCFYEYPPSNRPFYFTWEVKVSLLHKDGTESSLKAGKTSRTLDQLRAYRNFGAPQVALLDVYICDDGYMDANPRPSDNLANAVTRRAIELQRNGFGYSMLPLEYEVIDGEDFNLRVFRSMVFPFNATYDWLPSMLLPPGKGFANLMAELDQFSTNSDEKRFGRQVTFCRHCRR